jgi:GTP cyclohydrolase I
MSGQRKRRGSVRERKKVDGLKQSRQKEQGREQGAPERRRLEHHHQLLRDACSVVLTAIGEDGQREGLRDTPQRFGRAMLEMTEGYRQTASDIVGDAIFTESSAELVLVKRIEFYSLCEHHLLPFYGYAHVGYIPDGKIIGLSKIPRLVRLFSRRLQVQERLTEQIAGALDEILGPRGVGVVLEGHHLCMMMRGIQVQSGQMVTSAFRGQLKEIGAARDEFLRAVGR